MLDSVIIHILSFLGLAAGFIVAHNSWDELRLGDKYFRITKIIILLLIMGILALSLKFNFITIILFALGIFIGWIFRRTYLYLGIASVVSILVGNPLPIVALIFLYGLPEGSLLYYHTKEEHLKKETLINLGLFILPLALLFFPQHIVINSFIIGALLPQLL